MATNDKAEIEALIKQAKQQPGFKVGETAAGYTRIMAPGGLSCLAPRVGGGHNLANFRADLRRIGFNPLEIEAEKADRAAGNLAADRAENDRRLARAEERIEREQDSARQKEEARAAKKAASDAAKAVTDELRKKAKAVNQKVQAAKKVAVPTPMEKESSVPEFPTFQRSAPAVPPMTETPVPVIQPQPAFQAPFLVPGIKSEPERKEAAEGHAQEARALAGYTSTEVLVTVEQATAWLEHVQCRQRHFYPSNADKWHKAMEAGSWHTNPSDGIVFDEHTTDGDGSPLPHGCLINGQHRLWAVMAMDEEKRAEFYPDGVPFMVTYGFPSKLAHIFDTGKTRSASDALTVEGMYGWSNLGAAALRLALRYDQSFLPGGNTYWPNWKAVKYNNSDLVAAARGQYASLLEHHPTATLLYSSKMARSAGLVFGYLLARDNPHGGETGTNEDFVLGVSGKTSLVEGDPRMAAMRWAMRGGTMGRGNPDAGAQCLIHLLREYANWQVGKPVKQSQVDLTDKMPPVWTPGMNWYGSPKELRLPLR